MGKRLRETERKYEADERAVKPAFGGLPAVASVRALEPAELDAMYFDTGDLRLAVRRITLRRRTGGDDAGWHLKLPTGQADTRTEVHAPLGRQNRTVPEELAAEVAVYTRGHQLIPVVRLKNKRERLHLLDAAGSPLAEIAHDHVTAQVLDTAAGPSSSVTAVTWAETEAELVDGRPSLLDAVEKRLAAAGLHRLTSPSKLARALGDRLAAAPGPPKPPSALDTVGAAALAYLHEQVRDISAYDPAVRRDEEDAVHQLRVATRRLRSALKSFSRELDRGATDPVGDELKWLAGVLGTERDREVLAARLEERLAELDPGTATDAVKNRLRGNTAAAQPEVRTAVLRELNGDRYFALLDRLDAMLAAPPYLDAARAPASIAVAKAVRRDHRRLRRLVESALALESGHDRDEALHEARKAAKRARYSSEAAQPVLGKPAAEHTSRMKAMQQLLGEHHDSVMCRDVIAGLAEGARAAGEDTFPYGALTQLEKNRADEVEKRLPKAWRKADRGKLAG